MEDVKLFIKLVTRKYPGTKFGTSDISGSHPIMILVFTNDSGCVKFSEQVNTFLGNQFRLKFLSLRNWEKVNKNDENLMLDWVIKIIHWPSGFIQRLFN